MCGISSLFAMRFCGEIQRSLLISEILLLLHFFLLLSAGISSCDVCSAFPAELIWAWHVLTHGWLGRSRGRVLQLSPNGVCAKGQYEHSPSSSHH